MASESSLKLKRKLLPQTWDKNHWLSRRLEKWPLWGLTSLTTAILLGGISTFSLITQPPKPNCEFTFWPFASASVRLYCAQELAQDPTLENLLKAIGLVDVLGEDHPLRGAIDPRIEAWSKLVLDKAEESFHEGNLERAIRFAQKIPQKTAAAKVVNERIVQWKKIWAEGEAINSKVNAALGEEDWRKSFGVMVNLLYVENRYWSETRYNEITKIIIQAQKDEKIIAEAERFAKLGGFDNLNQAVKLVRELPDVTIFKKSIAKVFDSVGKQLIQIAEKALNDEDIQLAMNALSFIPKESKYWQQSKALSTLANATSLTWNSSSDGYLRAIEELSVVPKDSPIYNRAQALIRRWKGEIGNVKILEAAELKALTGEVSDLRQAIAAAYAIGRESEQWEAAQENIRDWTSQVQQTEDQPILDYANELSVSGDATAYQAAIAQASKIAPGRALYEEAQSQITYWRSRIDDFSDLASSSAPKPSSAPWVSPPTLSNNNQLQPSVEAGSSDELQTNSALGQRLVSEAQALAQEGSPQNLVDAISLANQVPLNAPERDGANQAIDNWATQLLNQAMAESNFDPQRAVEIARLIPRFTTVYNEAQARIRAWGSQSATSPQNSTP